jgi:hypothetical protein
MTMAAKRDKPAPAALVADQGDAARACLQSRSMKLTNPLHVLAFLTATACATGLLVVVGL